MDSYLLCIVVDMYKSHVEDFRIKQEVLFQNLKVCQIMEIPAKYYFSLTSAYQNLLMFKKGMRYINGKSFLSISRGKVEDPWENQIPSG